MTRRLALWGLVLALALASVGAQVLLSQVRQETRRDIVLFADELPGAIFAFERNLGYAGLIHAFKNHVLRPEEGAYRDAALRYFDAAMAELDVIEDLAREAEIPFDAETVRSTMVAYRENIDVVADAATRGLPPAEIDDLVRIDDGPATAALDAFLIATERSFRETVGGQIQTLNIVVRVIAVLSLALPLVIAGSALLRQREQTARMAESEALNRSLEVSNRQLTQSNQSLSDFAYVASHDLRTPMRAIANHARFLAEDHGDAIPEEARQRLARMEDLCAHTDTLVSKLHRYSRIDREQKREMVECDRILDAVRLEVSDMLDTGRARVEQDGALPAVKGDATEIETIFRHLILNGLTYNRSEVPTVRVGWLSNTEADGRPVENAYYVRDNGIGIDREMQADAFRIFKRLNPPNAFGQGTGSGLAFVKKAVESHGGNIWLTSVVDEGSTFYFTLSPPVAAAA